MWLQPATATAKPEVRPFITDDSRVIGYRLAQLEAWARVEKENFQQWLIVAYGPTAKIEISVGGVFGVEEHPDGDRRQFSYALPLIQGKFLFREYRPGEWPGIGMVVGTFLPNGIGSFRPSGYGSFGFLTISQVFGQREDLLLHGNMGANYLYIDRSNNVVGTWGFGTQVRTLGGFHLVGELFSGDPYVPGTGTAYQVGFRHFFSDLFQIDMTMGKGIGGQVILPYWVSAGIRLVSTRFQRPSRPMRL
ncbi:hypothetical protein GCM10023187_04540 [Nibrella viscosa]|uniref:MetA-pathway of phenol degradation n=1 Tax=Nibrella viscosa TaxID=1084524 RepID=A0ABP8JUZ1_9BACT